jgi:Tfp pilus assembly protein PilF
MGAALLLLDQPVVRICRRSTARGQRGVQLYPGNPRALEALAAEYSFDRRHALPAEDSALVPAGQTQAEYFAAQRVLTLRQAAACPNMGHYFPSPVDQAAFHLRLSAAFDDARQYREALVQAQAAIRLDPENYFACERLAHTYLRLKELQQAKKVFERRGQLLPSDARTQATHYTNFGHLLLFDLDRADLAFPKFRQAAISIAQLPEGLRHQFVMADIGLARREIRLGERQRGYQLIMQVLNADPQNALAGLVLAEYHSRSEHWQEAAGIYEQLIRAYSVVYPWFDWYYEALRGYQWVCICTGQLRQASLMWDQAVEKEPSRPEPAAFRAWSFAIAGHEDRIFAHGDLEEQWAGRFVRPAHQYCRMQRRDNRSGFRIHVELYARGAAGADKKHCTGEKRI